MRKEAQIMLAVMRETAKREIYIQDGMMDVLFTVLGITKQEGGRDWRSVKSRST